MKKLTEIARDWKIKAVALTGLGLIALGCEATPEDRKFTLEDTGRFGMEAAFDSVAINPNATSRQREAATIAGGVTRRYNDYYSGMNQAREGRSEVNIYGGDSGKRGERVRKALKEAYWQNLERNVKEGKISDREYQREKEAILIYFDMLVAKENGDVEAVDRCLKEFKDKYSDTRFYSAYSY